MISELRQAISRLPLSRGFAGFALLVTLLYGGVLAGLVRHAAQSELHSHILLMPLLVGYLLFRQNAQLPRSFKTSKAAAIGWALAGVCALVLVNASSLSANDALALKMFSYLCILMAGAYYFLGSPWVRAAAFPLLFLAFVVPLPDLATKGVEDGLVWATTHTLVPLFEITGTPALRDGHVFHVPGITLEVARECSGIRSTWVLLIVGLLGAYLRLRSPWRRVGLLAFLVPLGILRNALRILVVAMLCVHRGPEMIHSWVHLDGGPGFFLLSLLPLVGLIWWLRRGELRASGEGKESKLLGGLSKSHVPG